MPSLDIYQPGEHHLFLSGISLSTYLTQSAYHQKLVEKLRLKRSWKPEIDLSVLWPLTDLLLGLVLLEANLGTKLGLSCAHPAPTNIATNCGLIFSFQQVFQGQSQASLNIDLYPNTSQEAPKPKHKVEVFRPHSYMIQLALQVAYPKGDLSGTGLTGGVWGINPMPG